ncbi:MAG: SpoIIE family protein phosphatase [Actinomycetota bacterium]
MSQVPTEPQATGQIALSLEDLTATLNAVGDAITVQGPSGTLLWANDSAARLLGYNSPGELVAAPLNELIERFVILDEQDDPFPVANLPGRLALTGIQPLETLVRWRPYGSDRVHWSLVRATPVFDEDGSVRFAVNVFREDTARQVAIRSLQRSEERLAFLAAATRALLGAPLDPAGIAERLTEVCVPSLGDMCAVWEVEPDGNIRRIAERAAGTFQGSLEMDRTPDCVISALGGESILTGPDERGPESLTQAAVPIPGENGPVGAILVARYAPRPPMSRGDLEMIEEVGKRAAPKILNAHLYAERSRAAAVLSRSLVPAELPEVPGLDLHAFIRPAASGVGGDFYDVVSLADGRTLLLIADVSGKGPEAAALTAMARYTLTTLARYHASPAELLSAVNETLVDQLPDGRFCTLACGAFGPSPNGIRITVAVAGHPKPIILRASGEVENFGQTGFPLGIFYRLDPTEQDVVLGPGDSFLLVTDGCVGEGGAWESELHSALRAARPESAQEMAALVERVALGVQPDHPDDIAALVARITGGS